MREAQIVNKETLEQTGNNVDMGNFTNPTKGVVPAGVPEIERLTPQQFQQLVSEFKEHLVNKDARSLELPVYKMTSSPKGSL